MRTTLGLSALLLAGALGLWLLVAPQRRAPVVIGVLEYTSSNLPALRGFRDGLAELGYREGENLKILFDGPAPTADELEPRLRRLLARKPDLLYVSPTPAAMAAARLTRGTSLPVVFGPVNDPVAAALIRDPRHPEANLTGVRLAPNEDRRLRSLLEVVPGTRRVFVPYNPEDPSALASLSQLRAAAPTLGVTLLLRTFTPETDPLAPGYVPEEAQALFLPREGLVLSRIKDFETLSLRRGLGLSTPHYDQVRQGALTGIGFIGYEVGRQAARMAHLLLTGTPVADLPVETAEHYFFINMTTAKRLGLHVPEAVLRRADRIFHHEGGDRP